MSKERMPRRASWTARMVPEAPPPTIATGALNLVVRPGLRVRRASFALIHVVVHVRDRLSGGLREEARHGGVNDTGEAGADQARTDRDGSHTMTSPAHSERARMFKKHAVCQTLPLLVL